MIRIAMNGAAGRMGKRIIALIGSQDHCELVCALESGEHDAVGKDAGLVAGIQELGVPIGTTVSNNPDVLVDFSAPEACMERAEECAKSGIGLVVGTTGMNASEENRLKEEISRDIPVLVAPNMGLGVNILFRLAHQVAEALGEDFDVEIIEAHHRRKKDAPSGTAGELAKNVCKARGWDAEEVINYGRQGFTGERNDDELGMHAVRGGSIVGDHTVIFAGEGERIELTHRAQSRDLFARGAIHAAKFVAGKTTGFFTMGDVLFS